MRRETKPRNAARGISLIEAMVALAVMAFGTVAVLGVQATLRLNADVAKQRNEAVRIAQETLEAARAFGTLDGYEALATTPAAAVEGYTTNTSFQVAQAVADAAPGATAARRKTVTVDVSWLDRAGQPQAVQLSSAVQGTVPELAGSLSVPAEASLLRNPGARHHSIPPEAVPFGEGQSRFNPPGGGGIGWVFNNLTGYITRVCTGPAADSCVDVNARLLAGYVRFATGDVQPTGVEAETPPSTKPEGRVVQVQVLQTHPTAATVACFEDQGAIDHVPYYCAVPVGTEGLWSGRAEVVGLPLDGVFDGERNEYRICRYTPVRGCHPVVGATIWGAPDEEASCSGAAPTPSRRMTNAEHPLNYAEVSGALLNQNFLALRDQYRVVVDGIEIIAPSVCPGDGPSPYINANTWQHQPSS